MHLQRIQVPDFRVLKDVDITFEKKFIPRIFPLGSLNGGGKSTLLQLIFVLLHCSTNPSRSIFIKNMLEGFKIQDGLDKRVIALLDVWDGDKSVRLEFFSYKDSYVRNLLFNQDGESEAGDEVDNDIGDEAEDDEVDDKANDDDSLKFSVLEKPKLIKDELSEKQEEISALKEIDENEKHFREELLTARNELKELDKKYKKTALYSEKISKYLRLNKLIYICKYSVNENENDDEVLLCQIDNVDINKVELFLEELSKKVFLAAPITQVFLFISKESRQLLFRNLSNNGDDKSNSYYSEIQAAKSKILGFFAYDFLAVDLLIESFKAALDRDSRKAIETGGEYGTSYKELIKDLNLILANKKINPNIELSGVNFQLDRDDEKIELQPEDLSHGELKRLSIYLWLKYRNIENAIVLMDEIEIAFHPDWQYQIISDLQEWAPSNQYILATHSYELCQALTPAHVKELEPKLIKKQEA
jgi:energy-coupling factor transporter ATP-binding protein EcfA2